MRRLYLLFVLAVINLLGCERYVETDYYQYNATFDIVDETGNHLLADDEDAIYEVVVFYNSQTYRFDDETRVMIPRQFAIRRTPNPDYFNLGDVLWGTSGDIIIKFRGNSWNVRFETSKSAGKKRNDGPILESRIWVDDNPSVDGKSIIQLLYTPVDE